MEEEVLLVEGGDRLSSSSSSCSTFQLLVQLSGFQIAVREGSSLWKCPAAKENMESSLKNLLCSCSDVLFTSVSFLCYSGKPKNLMHSNIGLMAILPVKVNFTDL